MGLSTFKELKDTFSVFSEKFYEQYRKLDIEQTTKEINKLRESIQDHSVWKDPEKSAIAKKNQARITFFEKKSGLWQELDKKIQDMNEYIEIAEMENAYDLIPKIDQNIQSMKKTYQKIDIENLLDQKDDARNAFLNIHPGAGGTESQDWADMLYRAYTRWAESKGFQMDTIDYQGGDEAGIKNVTLLLKGVNVFGLLRSENGIHRLVRISPFDSNKKRHTSFASVHVSPEISDDVKVDVQEKDLRIDTFRASGAGGQHINKTDSAVRILHIPTGLVVNCQNDRSQIKNRATGMKILKAKLYELAQSEKKKEIESKSGERKDISWGNQIRSYVFHPYNLVKDIRTGYETGNIQSVMNGDFDPFIDAYLRLKK